MTVPSHHAPRETEGAVSFSAAAMTVFFDVDFTLIYPGPMFDGSGYRRFAARHGFNVDPARFGSAVATASAMLDAAQDEIYRSELFIQYACRVLEEMGGAGPGLVPCAEEIYDEWAVCQHFALYDDVEGTLRELHGRGATIGLISNTHRCLESFQAHFELTRYVSAAISSSDHGYMKPHPSIFRAALELVGAAPSESVMVGDSLTHDVQGAKQVGMRGVLISRSSGPAQPPIRDVPVIQTLAQLPELLESGRPPSSLGGDRDPT